MICLPDELNLAFTQSETDCCDQWPNALDVPLNQVYRSQTYWNSALVLPWYGASTDTWFRVQFHLVCQHDQGAQTFILRWFEVHDMTRHCEPAELEPPYELKAWGLHEQTCDPFQLDFRVSDMNYSACYPDGMKEPDDPDIICAFRALITE